MWKSKLIGAIFFLIYSGIFQIATLGNWFCLEAAFSRRALEHLSSLEAVLDLRTSVNAFSLRARLLQDTKASPTHLDFVTQTPGFEQQLCL